MLQLVADHEKAEQSYMDEGVRILELAQKPVISLTGKYLPKSAGS